MSMTETTEAPPVKPARKPAKRRAKRRKASVPMAKPDVSYLGGITVKECPKGCGPDGCVISRGPYCAHPRKGKLQHADMHKQDAVDRLAAAEKLVASNV